MNKIAEILWKAGLITTPQVEEVLSWQGLDVVVDVPPAGAQLELAHLGSAIEEAMTPRQTSFEASTLVLGTLTMRWPDANVPEEQMELEYAVEPDGTVLIGCEESVDVDGYATILANGLTDLDGIFFSDVTVRHTDHTLTHLACTPCRSPS